MSDEMAPGYGNCPSIARKAIGAGLDAFRHILQKRQKECAQVVLARAL